MKNFLLAICLLHMQAIHATTTAPAPASKSSNDTIKKVVGSLFGFKDEEPAPAAPAPAPAAPAPAPAAPAPAPAAPAPAPAAAPTQQAPAATVTPPAATVASVTPPPPPAASSTSEPDFSKIADPLLRSCAIDFNANLKKCTSTGGSCEYEAQNSFKGCVRPVIARRILKQHAPLFDEAKSEFLRQPLFRSCVDRFWKFVASCLGDKRCEEILYYSLHNDCGKRLYNTGFVAGRSAALENSFINNKGAAEMTPSPADEAPPPPTDDSVDVEAPPL